MVEIVGRRVVAIALAFATSGCSLLYRKGRPNVGDPPDRYVQCTNVYGPIVIDALLATSMTIGGIAAIKNDPSSEMNSADFLPFFLLPTLFALSGIYGYVHVDDCSKHHEAWARLHPESPNGPVLYPPPPVYRPPVQPPAPAPGAMPPVAAPGSVPPAPAQAQTPGPVAPAPAPTPGATPSPAPSATPP